MKPTASVFAFDVCLTATARVISTGSASPCQHHERSAVRPPNRTGCLRSDLRLCIGAALARHSRELRPAFGDVHDQPDCPFGPEAAVSNAAVGLSETAQIAWNQH